MPVFLRLLAGTLLALSALGCLANPAATGGPHESRILLTGGLVIDPSSSDPPRRLDVLIVGERIARVAKKIAAPPGTLSIDVRGDYIVPGLWDMHAHVAAVGPVGDALEDYVKHGVLGARDMGGRVDEILGLKREVAEGRRLGPTLFVAGPTLNGEQAAESHRLVRNSDEARQAVRELRGRGVDFIKIHRRLSREAFDAVRDETRAQGIRFAGHVPLAMNWIDASNGGMQSIEHIQTIVENEVKPGPDALKAAFEAMDRLDGQRGAEIFAAMTRNHTYWTPSLIFYESSWKNDAPAVKAAKQRAYSRLAPLVSRAARSGVPILAGTDLLSGRGEGLLDELDRLVSAGLSPREALRAATTTPYEVTKRGPGPIKAGGEASMLVIRGNPLTDIRALRQRRLVILRGRIIAGAPDS